MPLTQQLSEYIAACFTGLWIQSHEHEDALAEIAQLCRHEGWRLATWDVSQGLQVAGQNEEAESIGSDPMAAVRSINTLATPDGTAILVLSNFHRFVKLFVNGDEVARDGADAPVGAGDEVEILAAIAGG